MSFLDERYETLPEPIMVQYPTGHDDTARWIAQTIEQAGMLLTQLLGLPLPKMQLMLVAEADWDEAPRDDPDQPNILLPYWTDVTLPPCIVIPERLDPILGAPTQKKLAFLLYHELTHACLEEDPRPWPAESPLWADEWPLQYAALWLAQQVDGQLSTVMQDLHEQNAEMFEPEADGKTPVTVRGFDWYEDTTPEDYLLYNLLLEQFAADLLAHYSPEILPRFLDLYRKNVDVLLSDEVTEMLATVLGPGGVEWLEELVYF
jgi:hypothetical protein